MSKKLHFYKEGFVVKLGKPKNYYYNPETMSLTSSGYPKYKDSGKILHKYIAENYVLKRKLRESEEVHHVNGDKLDFHPENLVVLSGKDHKKIEKHNRKAKNLIIMYEIVVVFSLILLSQNTGVWNKNVNMVIGFLLIFALLIPFYPNLLRKILFKIGILKRNK